MTSQKWLISLGTVFRSTPFIYISYPTVTDILRLAASKNKRLRTIDLRPVEFSPGSSAKSNEFIACQEIRPHDITAHVQG